MCGIISMSNGLFVWLGDLMDIEKTMWIKWP